MRLERRGAGPGLLLLHGLSANRRSWDAVLPLLGDRFELCLPDLPGRGESLPPPGGAHDLATELRRLRVLLDAIRFAPCLVLGHSQGAALALALAAVDARVRGVVLVNPVHPWARRPRVLDLLRVRGVRHVTALALRPLRRPLTRCILRRTYGPARTPTRADVERYAAPYAEPERARLLLRILAEWRPAELERHLPGRPLEGRVIAGGRDRRIGLEGPSRLASRLGLEFRVLPEVGHVVPDEAPEAVARAVAAVATVSEASEHSEGEERRRAR